MGRRRRRRRATRQTKTGREPTHVALNPVDVLELETSPALSAFAHGSLGKRFVAGMRLVEDPDVPAGSYELWHDPDKASSSERPEGEEATKTMGLPAAGKTPPNSRVKGP